MREPERFKKRLKAFKKMEFLGFMPDSADYNDLIEAIAKSKNMARAEEILRDLMRRRKFSPDLKTYTRDCLS
ncbi:hypothetical protein KSP39_PZI010918 [Platanthera zijinensis]|uniref:Pentatricopeptide repeat-containing protein n=1 Tax=Platanthera zijinensis TaxID=2320716 RepID=A0AAP0G5U3_9ASPA